MHSQQLLSLVLSFLETVNLRWLCCAPSRPPQEERCTDPLSLDLLHRGRFSDQEGGWGGDVQHPWHAVVGVHTAHSVVEGLGACSSRKSLKFRPCKSASEAVGDRHIHAKYMATGG